MKLEFTEKDLLEAGVAEIIGEPELVRALSQGKKLQIKLGIDPTSPTIHLGRSIPLWRLRAFQELGHHIHLIIGDFTGQIGDTSDKESARPMLSPEEIAQNLHQYLDQVWMILNPAKKDLVNVHYNSEWLAPLTFAQIGQMADVFSVNAFIKRDLIARRLESGFPVSLREMLYPLMQGYDSIMVKADVEIGGTDQRFNLLAGRILQESRGLAAQSIIMNQLIRGTDGRKMSSSWGNVIPLQATASDMFGQIMACLDEVMGEYLLVLPLSARPFTAPELAQRLQAGENPRNLKLVLAFSIVALYHGEAQAEIEKSSFIARFSEGQKPEAIPTLSLATLSAEPDLIEVLQAAQFIQSRSEGRLLIAQAGIRLDDQTATDPFEKVKPGQLVQKGKRWFIQLVP